MYKEKMDHSFSFFKAHGEVKKLEDAMFLRGVGNGLRAAYASMRNRFVFLYSKTGVLRCESIYKAELSDISHVKSKAPKDVHQWTALIMQISQGMSIVIVFVN